MDNAIYKMLLYNKNAVVSTFEKLKKLKGLNCIITKPLENYQPYDQYEEGRKGSIFGLEDLVELDHSNSYPDKLLIFNLFQETSAGYDGFDSFIDNAYCLTLFEERFPLQTLIEIDFYGRKMYYKVDDHRNLSPSVVDQLLIKNILIPAT